MSSAETEEKEFVCGVDGCTASFSKKSSLEAHQLRVHKMRPSWSHKGPKIERETTEEGIPTDRDLLAKIFSDIGFKKGEAALNLIESYGFDVAGIYHALKDTGAGNSVMRYTLKRWSTQQGEEIPEQILASLKTTPYGIQRHPILQDPLASLSYAEALDAYAEKKRGGASSQSSEVTALRNEMKELRKELGDQKLENLKQQIQAQNDRFEDLKKSVQAGGNLESALINAVVKITEREGGGRIESAIYALMGLEKLPIEPMSPQPQQPAGPEKRRPIAAALAEQGLVTTIVEKDGRRYLRKEQESGDRAEI